MMAFLRESRVLSSKELPGWIHHQHDLIGRRGERNSFTRFFEKTAKRVIGPRLIGVATDTGGRNRRKKGQESSLKALSEFRLRFQPEGDFLSRFGMRRV